VANYMIPIVDSLTASQVVVTDANKKLTSVNGITTDVSPLVTLPSTTNTLSFTNGVLTSIS